MKSSMILCALATICCFSIGNAADNAGTAALTALKTSVHNTTDDLSSYKKTLVDDTQSELTKLFNVEFVIMSDINFSTRDEMVLEVTLGIADGKEANHCDKFWGTELTQAWVDFTKKLDRCTVDALATVYKVENSSNALLELGNRLANELDAIATNCISSDAVATENCIIGKIPVARSSVDGYRYNESSLKQNGDKTSSDAQISGGECYRLSVQTGRDEINRIRSDGRQCVANAGPAANAGTAILIGMNNAIDNSTDYLYRYLRNMYPNARAKLRGLDRVEYDIMIKLHNSTIGAIVSEVNQAIAADKDANPCFRPSADRLDKARQDFDKALGKCFDDATATIDSVKETIEGVVHRGNLLRSEIEAIFNGCISSDGRADQTCILPKIPETRSSLNGYLQSADLAVRNGDKAFLDAQECYQSGTQTLRKVIEDIRSDVTQCVTDALSLEVVPLKTM